MDISGLNGITAVEYDMVIKGNGALPSVNGLAALTSVGHDIKIESNAALTDIDGLAALTEVGGQIVINGNGTLAHVDGLSTLLSVGIDYCESWQGCLSITNNSELANVDGLAALTTVRGGVDIRHNATLADVNGLAALTTIQGYLRIWDNATLTDVDGLASLVSVEQNLIVGQNPQLSACTVGLGPILTGGGVGSTVTIEDNAPGCNSVCEVLQNCPPVATEGETPLVTGLAPLHPNPSRGAATLTYTLAAPASVTLTVYDALGRHVQTLAEGERPAGAHAAAWPSEALPAGVYVVRLAVGGEAWTQRVTLVR